MWRKFFRFAVWGLIGLIALVIFFYIEEDWRGARAWAKAKAEVEAQGISLDPKTYIPPPVPEAENFGALPIFRLEPDPKQDGRLKLLALDQALGPLSEHISFSKEQASEPEMLPYLGHWKRGEKPDIIEAQKELTKLCREATPPIQVPANASASKMLGLLCPALSDLRTADVTHPECRFELNYADPSAPTAVNMSVKLANGRIKIANALSYEERLAIYDNQSQMALDDLDVDWKIVSGLQKEPLLISGLVCAGVVSIELEVIREGLDQHVWSDGQLAGLDIDLGKIDFLTETQLGLRGDFVVVAIPWVNRVKFDRYSIIRNANEIELEAGQKLDWRQYLFLLAYCLASNGDFDRGLANHARLVILGGADMIDPVSRRVFPEKEGSLTDADSQALAALKSINRLAYTQVQVDEARIACRLERYRLAHGKYSDSLDALVPAYGPNLPHDIMNGEPYHYKPMGDGKYMLYSVGWNQKDDGGQVGPQGAGFPTDPDWVWTNYPDSEKTK